MKYKTFAFFLLLHCTFMMSSNVLAQALVGEISKEEFKVQKPTVVDGVTKKPISAALVSIPLEGKVDYSDSYGHFNLKVSSGKAVILSVQKEGYRPFSLTLQDGKLPSSLIIELEKKAPLSMVLSDSLLHLGDNSYSENSSGAYLINAPCVGPTFSKGFYVGEITPKTRIYVTIGSVIGIDTIQAMKLGQNSLSTATSTPVEIFVNKNKIGELKINGDNQKIPVPIGILKKLANNTLTVKTGINKNSFDSIDYDDIELMNLIVDIQN